MDQKTKDVWGGVGVVAVLTALLLAWLSSIANPRLSYHDQTMSKLYDKLHQDRVDTANGRFTFDGRRAK